MQATDESLALPSSLLVRFATSDDPDAIDSQAMLASVRALFDARSAILLSRSAQGGQWRAASGTDGTAEVLTLGAPLLEDIADRAVTEAACLIRGGSAGAGRAVIALTLGADRPGSSVVVMVSVDSPDLPRAVSVAGPLVQLAPDTMRLRGALTSTQLENERLGKIIDIVGRVDRAARFRVAAQQMVDALCSYMQASQVALCWRRGKRAKVVAVSHMDSIPRRTELARLMEEAVDEAAQQGRELMWPLPSGDGARAWSLTAYVRESGASNVVVVPIGIGGDFVGALVMEGTENPLSEPQLWLLRLLADQAVTRLIAYHEAESLLATRLWRETANSLRFAQSLTLRRSFLAAVALCALVGLAIMPLEHRVHAPAVLRTDQLAQVGAPFDGFIDAVLVKVGDPVVVGQVLFRLKTRELLLERASALADVAQYEREAQKHQASGAGADMRIALAQVEQARARLQHIDFRISAAEVRSPIDGLVVEGDLPQQLGAPLRRGEPGFRVAGREGIYVDILVHESDISLIHPGTTGEVALVGQPAIATAIRVSHIVPMASLQGGENAITVRGQVDSAEGWWRPGMTGIARLDAGQRPVWWLATRRLLDFARIQLWW
ncbi:efflux RND transporter periplasmic adaptor subunit [Falsiroseomonas stagni]|uniref:GAF domain-containing protein n=1 Tax=Falsiroseomonas stagni DSM 19981 TaxID=1123062 RepID=A0A1I4F9R2_9PROT|nr:efflux RND transporter periplasmic adaptor subunit [Falsiroseomonas stagni]SFL13546.1 GAF domain-containing protein [Falsiroseomonas stagni DSM 19981]